MNPPDLTAAELAQLSQLLAEGNESAAALVFRVAPSLVAMAMRTVAAERKLAVVEAIHDSAREWCIRTDKGPVIFGFLNEMKAVFGWPAP